MERFKNMRADDKLDGFFFYTRYIKFGVGRAMMDVAKKLEMVFN